ncbi:hypothetical protein DL96DRAFT_1509557 [Flagelloscypha sp. PMI_526]|nr:hypothetical protein DL96DRAFT_1509557 [Flagelloscypha sp. PMI_526]
MDGISQSPSPVKAIERDSEFYFEGECLIFEVQSRPFRVPSRKLIEHSGWFKDMMEFPTQSTEGDTDENPILFQQVNADVFRNALRWVFKGSDLDLSFDQWVEMFRFARNFQFDQLERYCLDKLVTPWPDPMGQLNFCREFDLPYLWAYNAYIQLCKRPRPFTIAEVRKMSDWQLFSTIAYVRESYLKGNVQASLITIGWGMDEWSPPQRSNISWKSPTKQQIEAWISEAQSLES